MCLKLLHYNVATYQYVNPQDLRIDRFCNGLLIHNTGTTLLYANGDVIPPGGSKTIGGNYGEIFSGPLELKFVTQSPAPLTIVNMSTITQKYYTNQKNELQPG